MAMRSTLSPSGFTLRASPFAFLTAWDGEIDARYCNVPMLGKPFSLAELESCLQALVGGRIKPADREAA